MPSTGDALHTDTSRLQLPVRAASSRPAARNALPRGAQAVREQFLLRNCDCVTVKGKTVGVRVHEVMGRRSAMSDGMVRSATAVPFGLVVLVLVFGVWSATSHSRRLQAQSLCAAPSGAVGRAPRWCHAVVFCAAIRRGLHGMMVCVCVGRGAGEGPWKWRTR